MNICDINPYIRYARQIILTETGGNSITRDHRLFYVKDGKCAMRIEKNEYALQKGSVVLLRSGTEYKFGINDQVKLSVLNFDYTQKHNNLAKSLNPVKAENFRAKNIIEQELFSDTPMLNSPIVIVRMYEISQQLEHLIEERQKNILYSNEFASAMLKEIILKILRYAPFSSTDAHEKIMRVIRYIEENYSKNITNDELAKISGYHPYHLNRLMNEYAKTTVHKYLVNFRLNKSTEYLTNTNLSVSEISDLCGFETPYYFSNLFKRKIGISPLQYRKTNKNKI